MGMQFPGWLDWEPGCWIVLNRQMRFEHPATGEWVEIVSPFPPDLQAALDQLRADS